MTENGDSPELSDTDEAHPLTSRHVRLQTQQSQQLVKSRLNLARVTAVVLVLAAVLVTVDRTGLTSNSLGHLWASLGLDRTNRSNVGLVAVRQGDVFSHYGGKTAEHSTWDRSRQKKRRAT